MSLLTQVITTHLLGRLSSDDDDLKDDLYFTSEIRDCLDLVWCRSRYPCRRGLLKPVLLAAVVTRIVSAGVDEMKINFYCSFWYCKGRGEKK